MSPEEEIRSRVAFARQSYPHITEATAESFIAEGLTPSQASARLYDLISEPIEAGKIVAQYRASKSKG